MTLKVLFLRHADRSLSNDTPFFADKRDKSAIRDLTRARRSIPSHLQRSSEAAKRKSEQPGWQMQSNLNPFLRARVAGEQPTAISAKPLGLASHSRSLAMQRISDQIQKLGDSRFILIEGEAGAGKQTLARRIYALSQRPSDRPIAGGGMEINHGPTAAAAYVAEDAGGVFGTGCASLEEQQSYAIAQAARRAAGGVLVLRGIDALDAAAQARLLHFVRSFENGTASPVSPLRIICTSRLPLRAQVLNGKFLPELYYRLSAVCILLPPLRERKEDIPGLAQRFIESFSRERRRPLQGLGQGALAVLLRHRWPGNVRELESVIRAACFATEGQWIRPLDLIILPLAAVQSNASIPAPPQDLSLDGVMRRHVRSVLKLCGGNKARAASRLGISRSTLYRMLDADADTDLGADDSEDHDAGSRDSDNHPGSDDRQIENRTA